MRLDALAGDSWTMTTARNGFPILVEYARARRPITYGEWDRELISRGLGHHVLAPVYGHPAGRIGNACAQYGRNNRMHVPPINLLIVNQNDDLPGDGSYDYIKRFCQEFLKRPNIKPELLSVPDRSAIIKQAHEQIFDFLDWEKLLEAYGLSQPRRTRATKPRHPNPSNWSRGPESIAHQQLKEKIKLNPQLVGLASTEIGELEFNLWSGDKVDVYFQSCSAAVEVKTKDAARDEIHRGVFQCVKYQAVLRAQQITDQKVPTASCRLAIGGRLPADLRDIVKRLSIPVFENLQ